MGSLDNKPAMTESASTAVYSSKVSYRRQLTGLYNGCAPSVLFVHADIVHGSDSLDDVLPTRGTYSCNFVGVQSVIESESSRPGKWACVTHQCDIAAVLLLSQKA